MNENTVHFSDLLERTHQILSESREFLLHADDDNLIRLAEEIPHVRSDGDPVNIVFAGQYSSGKSTLLSILTGENLKSGGGITTATTKSIEWHGITLWDTPGILTDVHPEHDAITKSILSKADLIVYVLTPKLFDPALLKDFRGLAFSQDRKGEIMLVVNKMCDEGDGNTPEARDIKCGDISKSIYPADLKDFYVTFVDADSWRHAQKETDPKRREYDMTDSNIEQLEQNLDAFSKNKGWIAQKTSCLYELDKTLDDAQNLLGTGTGDKAMDMALEDYRRQQRIYIEARNALLVKTNSVIREFSSFSKEQAANLANIVENGITQQGFEQKEEKILSTINKKFEETRETIKTIIEEEGTKLNEKLEVFDKSEFAGNVVESLANRLKRMDPLFSGDVSGNAKKVAQGADKFGQWLVKNTKGINPAKKGLSGMTGSNLHEAVLKVGHFLGHNFEPYEALKWTKGLKCAGKALSAAGIVIGVAGQIVDDVQENRIAGNLKANRDNIRTHYFDGINRNRQEMIDGVKEVIETNITPKINEFIEKTKELNAIADRKDADQKEIIRLREKAFDIIKDFHRLDAVRES
jgi:small GTP-binding protein